ncbi:MAG TPA: DUF2239 family protein [Pseudomonadales bacterium]
MSQPTALFAFDGPQRIAAGAYVDVTCKVSTYLQERPQAQVLIFNADTGKQVDLDLRGGPDEIRARADAAADYGPGKAGKGRPKLGVTAKEVTLLPRHWDWLAVQPGGASVTLRKLVERASKDPDAPEQRQARASAAYNFMHAVAGDLPGFEEASRQLFAGNLAGVAAVVTSWPGDIGEQVLLIAG